MLKLNFGGGEQEMAGWETVDLFARNPNYRVDLTKFPWPFEDSSADAAAMFHFLEHVDDVEKTVQEVHRILKNGGEFWVIVPHAKNPCAHDISHRHFFTSVSFSTICDKTYYRFGGKQIFRTSYFRMPLLSRPLIKWTPLDPIANRFPYFFEKFLPFGPVPHRVEGHCDQVAELPGDSKNVAPADNAFYRSFMQRIAAACFGIHRVKRKCPASDTAPHNARGRYLI